MTDKRFQWCERIDIGYVDEFVVDNLTKKELDEEDMCDLLNKLHEENKKQKDFINQLQEELVFFKTANVNVIQRLKEENKELKKEVKEYKEAMKRMMMEMMGSE